MATVKDSKLELSEEIEKEITSLGEQLVSSGQKYSDVEKRLEKYVTSATATQEAVDRVVKSDAFKRWGG